MIYWKERRGAHLDKLMLCPLKLHITKVLRFLLKSEGKNSSVNYGKDDISLVLSKVPAQKCFSKNFFRWFLPDELRDIIPKETSNNAGA